MARVTDVGFLPVVDLCQVPLWHSSRTLALRHARRKVPIITGHFGESQILLVPI